MGVVDDGRVAPRRAERLEAAGYVVELAQDSEYLQRFVTQHARCAVDRKQIGDIELAHELDAHLVAVDVQQHSLERHLQDARPVVGHAAGGVGADGGGGVLHHVEPVFVVGVGDGEGLARQHVKEGLLGVAIVLECLVIVEVVAGQIGEDAARKGESAYSLLRYAVAAALHKGVLAALLHHARQQRVERHGVGRCLVGGHGLVIDIVAYRGAEAALEAHLAKHIVEQCGYRCLAVGTRDAYERQVGRRVAVEQCADRAYDILRAFHPHECHTLGALRGHLLAHHCHGAARYCRGDELVSVHLRAALGDKEVALLYEARVYLHAADLNAGISGNLLRLCPEQYFFQFHSLI